MADIEVHRGKVSEGRIASLEVHFHGLPKRTIDRDTAIAWLKDGHSLVPVTSGSRGTALQLVEAEGEVFVRDDNTAASCDHLPF